MAGHERNLTSHSWEPSRGERRKCGAEYVAARSKSYSRNRDTLHDSTMIQFWQFSVLYWSVVAAIEVWFVYQYVYLTLNARWKLRVQEEIVAIRRGDVKKLLGEGGSEVSMIQMGSIFIASAGILLSASVQRGLGLIAFSAAFLVTWWLFSVQLSTRLMMDAKMQIRLVKEHRFGTNHTDPCDQEEGEAHFLRRFYGDTNGEGLMMKMRRNHWLFYPSLLLVVGAIIVVWP